jgi:hypothetical protein
MIYFTSLKTMASTRLGPFRLRVYGRANRLPKYRHMDEAESNRGVTRNPCPAQRSVWPSDRGRTNQRVISFLHRMECGATSGDPAACPHFPSTIFLSFLRSRDIGERKEVGQKNSGQKNSGSTGIARPVPFERLGCRRFPPAALHGQTGLAPRRFEFESFEFRICL